MAYRVEIRDQEAGESHRLRRCSPDLAAHIVADVRVAYPAARVRVDPSAPRRGGGR